MDDNQELWEQLDNESGRQYEGFKIFRSLPPKDRTLIGAWRVYSQNDSAPKVPPNFKRWHDEFAWLERSRAYDIHIERIRMRGEERAIEEAARELATSSEHVRNRMFEMLTHSYEKSIEWFETHGTDDLRAQDVMQIIRLHIEAADKFSDTVFQPPEQTWTEEDDRELAQEIMEEFGAERAREILGENDPEEEDEDEEESPEDEEDS